MKPTEYILLVLMIFGLFWITNRHIDEAKELILKKLKEMENKTK